MAAKKKASKGKGTPVRKATLVKTPMTKTAMLEQIAGNTGITKKQASSVFDELATLI
jgi:nucleoid DNA-binding protein